MTNNWKDIDLNFTEELARAWENHGFTFNQVRDWINIGLIPTDANFVFWLEQSGHTALAVLNKEDLQVLRKDYQKSLTNPQSNFTKPSKPWWKLLLIAILTFITYYLLKE